MAQTMNPISTVTNDGTYRNGSADYTNLSDATDSTFWVGDNNATDTLEVGMTDLSSTPPDAGTCTVTVRQANGDSDTSPYAPASSGNDATFDIYVMEGASTVTSSTGIACNVGAWTDDTSVTFNATSVTDWSNVRVRIISNGTGGTPSGRRAAAVTKISISTPDYTPPALGVTVDNGSLTLSGSNLTLTYTSSLDVTAGSLTLAGNTVTIEKVAYPGTLTLAGSDLTLAIGAGDLGTTVTAGSLTLSGSEIPLKYTSS